MTEISLSLAATTARRLDVACEYAYRFLFTQGRTDELLFQKHGTGFYLCHVPGKEVHQFVPDTLSSLCDNHMPEKESDKPAHKWHHAFWVDVYFAYFVNKSVDDRTRAYGQSSR